MEQQLEARDSPTNAISPGSNTVLQLTFEDAGLSSSTSSDSNTISQLDYEDERTPLLLSVSQRSNNVQQHEERVPNHRASSKSPRVEEESTQAFSSGPVPSGIEQQHEHSPPSLSSSDIQHSIENDSASNIFVQQVKPQQDRLAFLFDPSQSSIMIRRNAQAESASEGRSSISEEGIQNVNPKRVKQLISSLGFDDERSEMLYKLVIATAPFYRTEAPQVPPVLQESDPKADALRESLGNLMFAPKSAAPVGSPTAETAKEDFSAGVSTENPTGSLLFDADAAENLGSYPLGSRSESPPLLWSTAAAEESLDPNAEDPTYFTVAEFINTIIEKGIQVESVTDEDWWIEEVRVAILDRLKHDAAAEDLPNEEEVFLDEDLPNKEDPTAEEDAKEVVVTKDGATEQVKARGDTSESDLQRWKKQGPDGWLKRDDGTDMNEDEIDEECARWDAMVRKARQNKVAEKGGPSLGKNLDLKDKGFWEYVRSSRQKEQAQGSISTHGQDEKASVSTQDQEEKMSQKKSGGKKNKNKNKNKNRKAKKNALKGENSGSMSEEVRGMEIFPHFLDLPTQVRKKVLNLVLMVHQELIPYHYVKGKVIKNIGVRKKPELNILLALCSSKDKKVKRCLDDAKNVLYRGNTFSIRKPNELIMFLGTIGADNIARLKMGENLLLTDTFFDKRRQYILETKWLARWGKDLLFAMKGYNIFRSDIAAETSEEDLTCEPTDIEKALKSMTEVMKHEGEMYEMLNENGNGSGCSPIRLQSLDLGEDFDSLAEQIKTMGLAVNDDEITKSDAASMLGTEVPDGSVESISEKWKRKAREAGKDVQGAGEAKGYGELFLEMVTNLDEDEEDVLSQDSGFYTPSVYSEHCKKPTFQCKVSS